jgi:LysM repeat protein
MLKGRIILVIFIAFLAMISFNLPGFTAISIETSIDRLVSPSDTLNSGNLCFSNMGDTIEISFYEKSDLSVKPSFSLNISSAVQKISSSFEKISINRLTFCEKPDEKPDEKPENTILSGWNQTRGLIDKQVLDNSDNTGSGKKIIYRNFHRVRPGQSLWLISKMYGFSVDDLQKINNLTDTSLNVNQKIYLPDSNYIELAKRRNNFLSGRETKNTALKAESKKIFNASSKWPVAGGYRFSSAFGMRMHPLLKRWKFHNGVDLAAKKGTPIIAPCAGVVTFSGWKAYSGRTVMVEHRSGYTSIYCHCSSINVKKGEKIVKGQLIAKVGRTGSATGSHLHFSIKQGDKYCNPVKTVTKLNRL